MASLSVALLGGFEARLASGATLHLPTKKAQAVLAYLALRSGRGDRRDKLAAVLWGERSHDLARGGLRRALVDLRKTGHGGEALKTVTRREGLWSLSPAWQHLERRQDTVCP
jgi:DNA-binding SARP family transcriptional activator